MTNLFRLDNKKALITGGGSGIGQAIARLFSRQGATVHIFELTADHAQNTLVLISDEGGTAFAHTCDVGEQAQVIARVADVGRVDILVNNAGIAHVGTVETTTEADFDRIVRVNIKGMYNCLHAVVPTMRANGGGVILNMSSIAATVGIPDRFAYSMSKGATLSMTQSVARDYLHHNIRCNCISPARVHTPFVDGFIAKNYPGQETEVFEKLSKSQPIGRMGQPDEIAAMALFLCSDQAGFITGNDYAVDGGFVKLNN